VIKAVEAWVVVLTRVVNKAEIMKQTDLDRTGGIRTASLCKPGHADRDAYAVIVGIGVNMTRVVQERAETFALQDGSGLRCFFPQIIEIFLIHRDQLTFFDVEGFCFDAVSFSIAETKSEDNSSASENCDF
jgi:hypothetical protein